MADNRIYLCCDLKSFYASVECAERGLDPMTTNLVVADPERTETTICLAVSPSMKKLGVKNRCRVFEIPKNIDYIMAQPRMHLYIEYSVRIYKIYLRYFAKEDIHPYSIDECFMDVTNYLPLYRLTPKQMGLKLMQEIFRETGISATCGVGTNLYLAKIAMDILAKHSDSRIALLNEERFRKTLWQHKPLTDFWRIGAKTEQKLARYGISTMEQIAHCDESLLYRLFGVNAELLIDHAWGRECVTIADIKAYQPKTNSLTNGQVLPRNYNAEEALLVTKEMTEVLSLELVSRKLATESITLYLGYSHYTGQEGARGTIALGTVTSSSRKLVETAAQLYNRIVDKHAKIRRITVVFNRVEPECGQQYDLFSPAEAQEREKKLQEAMLGIRDRFGKNAVLRGMNYLEGGTTLERNLQIGGHKA